MLKNARVVDPFNNVDRVLDIGIEDGKIAALGSSLNGNAGVDCEGKTLIPGVIDMHVHVTKMLGGLAGYRMAAKTGVTTIIDFAGPMQDILENAAEYGCGLNVGCLDVVHPDNCGSNPSFSEVENFLEQSLRQGSLGLKLLGGHFPLTPEAAHAGIRATNERGVLVAFHCGSTKERSDILGMRESVELARGYRLIIPHINAYCRGKHFHYLEELRQAFEMLRENPNILADSHMAVMNGTAGGCHHGIPHDSITVNCLKLFGFEPTEQGLGNAILDGIAKVVAPIGEQNNLLERKEAYDYWKSVQTNTSVSFPVNIASVAVACVVERRVPTGGFLIPMTATDGGGFPRNNLIGRLLSLYHLDYISLEDIVRKASLNPARVFGLTNKGHLAPGADADITVLNEGLTMAVESYSGGKQIMKDGIVTGKGACLITTKAGIQSARRHNLSSVIADLSKSSFYAPID